MYVETRLGRWFYEEHGQAKREGDPAIVLWHSFLCDGGMWRGQIGPLSELGRVIVFDGPGHGRTEPSGRFSLWTNAHAAVDALSELGVDKAVWCGVSWGGMIGMRLAVAHPDRVAALALVDTSPLRDTRKNRLKYTALSWSVRPFGIPKPVFERMMGAKLLGATTLRERPELVGQLWERTSRFPIEGVFQAARAILLERDDVTARLREVRCPTLVVFGDEDRVLPIACAHAITDNVAGSRLQMIHGAGHLAPLERPEAFNDVLLPFVRERMG